MGLAGFQNAIACGFGSNCPIKSRLSNEALIMKAFLHFLHGSSGEIPLYLFSESGIKLRIEYIALSHLISGEPYGLHLKAPLQKMCRYR